MKKEKKIKTYQRKTKSGKVVTVKAHTAKYDAAEKAREAAKKKGAGDELDYRKKMPDPRLSMNEYLDELKKRSKEMTEEAKEKVAEKEAPKKTTKKSTTKETKKEPKKETKKVSKETKSTEPAFTAAEFKEWYRGTGSATDKKVAKALRAQLGRSGYRKFEDEAIDNYSSRGHLSMFKRVSGGGVVKERVAETKTPKSSKGEAPSLKVGSSIQMGSALSSGKGGKETFKVLTVQNANKQDREFGNTETAWVQRKDGSVTLALKDSKKGWMYDDTWSDFTDRKSPYAKSLEAAGYSFKKAKGQGGDYWDVKEANFPNKAKSASKAEKSSSKTSEAKYGFSKSDWASYQDDGSDSKVNARVEKGLKKYLGAKAYKQYGEYQDRSINGEGVSLERSYAASMRVLERFKKGEGDKVLAELSKAYERAGAKTKAKRETPNYLITGNRENPKFKDIRKQIEKADISDSAKKRLLHSIDKPYSVVSPATMKRRLEKELFDPKDKSTKEGGTPKKSSGDRKALVSTLEKQLKEFNGRVKGSKSKNGVIGVSVEFGHYLDHKDFSKQNKNWRATTNNGTTYELIYLNKEGKAELKKRGFKL